MQFQQQQCTHSSTPKTQNCLSRRKKNWYDSQGYETWGWSVKRSLCVEAICVHEFFLEHKKIQNTLRYFGKIRNCVRRKSAMSLACDNIADSNAFVCAFIQNDYVMNCVSFFFVRNVSIDVLSCFFFFERRITVAFNRTSWDNVWYFFFGKLI